MFRRFLNNYVPDDFAVRSQRDWTDTDTARLLGVSVPSYTAFLAEAAWSSFSGGKLRVLLPDGPLALEAWNEPAGWSASWPRWRASVRVFAYDWLGRLLAFDTNRMSGGQPLLCLLDPNEGELYEIPDTFDVFIKETIISAPDACVEASAHREWIDAGGAVPHETQCAACKVPLFLGGSIKPTNLEVSNLDVHLSICGQLSAQTEALPAGSRVGGVQIK
jgi:hypothetical protein